jgi:hypothetical protein
MATRCETAPATRRLSTGAERSAVVGRKQLVVLQRRRIRSQVRVSLTQRAATKQAAAKSQVEPRRTRHTGRRGCALGLSRGGAGKAQEHDHEWHEPPHRIRENRAERHHFALTVIVPESLV